MFGLRRVQSSDRDVKALVQTVADLQRQIDELRGTVADARMRYLEALDKTISRLQGRLARKLREEQAEDAPGPTISGDANIYTPPPGVNLTRRLRGF